MPNKTGSKRHTDMCTAWETGLVSAEKKRPRTYWVSPETLVPAPKIG